MPQRVLILGGARFHGYQLAQALVKDGHDVYVLNRGQFRQDYPKGIKHLKADRNNTAQIQSVLGKLTFDAVVDNNGYNPMQIAAVTPVLADRCGHYVFVSTAAVYMAFNSDHELKESEASGHLATIFSPRVYEYALNKFRAEEFIRENLTELPHTIIRFPNVFGPGDFLGKLAYFETRLLDGRPILLESDIKRFSLISAADAVRIIMATIGNPACFSKTFNAADPDLYDLTQFFKTIWPDFYDPDRIKYLPAALQWAAGYFLPLAWGPALDTSVMMETLDHPIFNPLVSWAQQARAWERQHFGNRSTQDQFLTDRNLELELLAREGLWRAM